MDGMDGEWSVRVVSHVMLMAYNQLTIPEMASPFARCCGFEVGALFGQLLHHDQVLATCAASRLDAAKARIQRSKVLAVFGINLGTQVRPPKHSS